MARPTPLLLYVAPLLLTSPAAGREVFDDREAFLDALSVTFAVIDFEGLPVGPVVGDPWAEDGVEFDEVGVGDNMGIGDGGSLDNLIFAQGGAAADIAITLTKRVNAFGLEVFSNDVQTADEYVVFYDVAGGVLASVPMPLTEQQEPAFVGLISPKTIARVEFLEDDGPDFAGISGVGLGWGLVGLTPTSTQEPHLSWSRGVVSVTGAPATGPMLVAASRTSGRWPIAGELMWAIELPTHVATLEPNAAGEAQAHAPLPAGLVGTTLYWQAFQPSTGLFSSLIEVR